MLNVILGILQLILMFIIFMYELRKKSAAVFLWATLLVMFGIMHFITTLVHSASYSDEVLIKASLFSIGFCIIYLIIRFILSHILHFDTRNFFLNISYDNDGIQANANPVLYKVFVLSCVVSVLLIIQASGGLLNTSWVSGNEYVNNLGYINSNQFFSIIYFSLSGLLCVALIKKEKARIIVLSLCIIAVVIISRNRIQILPLLVCFIACYLFKIKRIRFRTIIIGCAIVIFTIFIIYGIRAFRFYGSIEDFMTKFSVQDFMNKIREFITNDDGELGLRNYFYYFISYDNNFKDFGKGYTYIRMLLVYIPTKFSFGFKPEDFAQIMAAASGRVQGASTHPTLLGDCYANFGWFGIFAGGFWAIFTSIADKIVGKFKLREYAIIVYILFATMYAMIARGAVYNAYVNIAWGIVVLWVLSKLTIGKKHL